jgi:hypothetical protein
MKDKNEIHKKIKEALKKIKKEQDAKVTKTNNIRNKRSS